MVEITTLTVDASFFLNAFRAHEAGHAHSKAVLAHLQKQAIPLIVPNLLRAEVAGALARGQDDPTLAHRSSSFLFRLPHVVAVTLDSQLAAAAAGIAADYRLKGADAVYVAVAARFGSSLLTRDEEQRERGAAVVATLHPSEIELPRKPTRGR